MNFFKKLLLIFFSILSLLVLPACWDTKVEKPKFVIVNILDKKLFDDCHIKGSINVPFEDLKDYAPKHWDKEETEVVVHCSNYKCTASGTSFKILKELGFKKVSAYEAGTAEAKKQGIAMQGPCQEKYLDDYKKPDGYQETAEVTVITTENLKKKMKEFAAG